MSNKPTLQFLQSKDLGQAGSLEAILDSIHKLGFKIKNIRVGEWVTEVFATWKEYTEEMLDELSVAYEKKHLVFFAMDDQYDEKSYLTLWFKLSWDSSANGGPKKQQIHVYSADSQLFTRKEFDREYYAQKLLTVGSELYSILQPEFGWIERCPSRGYTKERDIKKLAVSHIYWANFFSPSYVKKLGQEFLQNAPGWKKESLPDGGFLYVLSSNMAGTGRDKFAEEVKNYFGVSSVRRK